MLGIGKFLASADCRSVLLTPSVFSSSTCDPLADSVQRRQAQSYPLPLLRCSTIRRRCTSSTCSTCATPTTCCCTQCMVWLPLLLQWCPTRPHATRALHLARRTAQAPRTRTARAHTTTRTRQTQPRHAQTHLSRHVLRMSVRLVRAREAGRHVHAA